MTYNFFYFWSGSIDKENNVPEGEYNGLIISKTSSVVGDGIGVDWQKDNNGLFRGKLYQKISWFPHSSEINFTLGSDDSDTLIVRYIGFDANQEQIFKKQPNELFVAKISGSVVKVVTERLVFKERCKSDIDVS